MAINLEKLGAEIANLRKSRGLKQRELAEQSSLTVNYVSLVENGQRTLSLDALERVCKVLSIDSELLLFLGREPSREEPRELSELAEALKQGIRSAASFYTENTH